MKTLFAAIAFAFAMLTSPVLAQSNLPGIAPAKARAEEKKVKKAKKAKKPKAERIEGEGKKGKRSSATFERGTEESKTERSARLRAECKGRPNAGACQGYTN